MEEALIKRIPPHSPEAEKSVIGSMLMDRDAVLTALEILTKEDFYEQQYGIIFEAMKELAEKDKPVDVITLQNARMCRRNLLTCPLSRRSSHQCRHLPISVITPI